MQSAAVVRGENGRASQAARSERVSRHGRAERLIEALDAVEALPALVDARDAVLTALLRGRQALPEVVSEIEGDPALTIRVLRAANVRSAGRAGVDSLAAAVETLGDGALAQIAERAPIFDRIDLRGPREAAVASLRRHAVATQRAADALAVRLGYEHRDRLAVTSLLHDIGRSALELIYDDYGRVADPARGTPEARVESERRAFGIDHALIGGVVIRRLGLPESVAEPIERHHDPDRGELHLEAGLICLADMLAHHAGGAQVATHAMVAVAGPLGLTPFDLRQMMYRLDRDSGARRRPVAPCPLTPREFDVLRALAEGRIYRQVAIDLGISPSTVRSVSRNICAKLGAHDRAQAVICASKNGWL